ILNICHCFLKKHEALKTHISKPIETRRLKFKLFSDESENWLTVRGNQTLIRVGSRLAQTLYGIP
ncbi:MAG TPA: hypothetical protein P5174_03455, partial [Dysgonamonadaceae bacterium]|nr:hypothetical protein [Dysgonamonadaceae bacterium]